ncbi:hypothetical protein DY000_02032000 [Brassica cretica]|uniref:Uncharacterized protein n=1 Tax=Brassica cretica TaxID=69181 RepID=A0ABQ7E0S1_BRACR|nr:hypothetical protein DY000_02032000 [Brassica cretica]
MHARKEIRDCRAFYRGFRFHLVSRPRSAPAQGVPDPRRTQPQLPFAPDDQAIRDPTGNNSRPQSAARDLSLNPFAVSPRPGQLASSPARCSFFGGPVSTIN